MSILTSRFDTRVLLQENTPAKNTMYEVEEVWTDYKYTYATVTNTSQGSIGEDGELFYDVFSFYIRYDSNIQDNFRKYRIKHEGDYYRIISKVVYERNKTLILKASMYNNE